MELLKQYLEMFPKSIFEGIFGGAHEKVRGKIAEAIIGRIT